MEKLKVTKLIGIFKKTYSNIHIYLLKITSEITLRKINVRIYSSTFGIFSIFIGNKKKKL